MKGKTINLILKSMFLLVLLAAMTFMAGCETEKWTTDEMESAGLTDFQTKDIYGADVGHEIFQGYDLTMVNVWGTFCGPCLDEMPDLGELQNEYEPKGVNIVGIVVDVQDENLEIISEQIELAKDIAEGTGADYTHLLLSTGMLPVLRQFDAIPASFFVDGSGNIVSETYIGSRSKEEWIEIIEANKNNQE